MIVHEWFININNTEDGTEVKDPLGQRELARNVEKYIHVCNSYIGYVYVSRILIQIHEENP